MACGFYRYGHDLHSGHLDFARPTSLLFNHPKRPPPPIQPTGRTSPSAAPRALQALHIGRAGLGHTFLIGQPTTPLFLA